MRESQGYGAGPIVRWKEDIIVRLDALHVAGLHRGIIVLGGVSWALLVDRGLLTLWLITLNQVFPVLYEVSNVV